jgi:dTDP-4-amino-4,6-dideoxygalactose transaminase
MKRIVPLFRIYRDEHDIQKVSIVVKRGMYWTDGPDISELEKSVCKYFGIKHAALVNSGTSALHLSLLAHGIGQGDEVIVPSFTFIATANAPLFVGAKPVFADIEPETYGLDPECVKKRITNRTKAIIPIHYGGMPCHIKELKQIAIKHNLILIEDAAEAFGADIDGIKVGNFGDSAILSFCQNKIITTGEGGAVLTNSKHVYDKLKLFRSHGRLETDSYFTTTKPPEYVDLGYNFRMSSISAALGLSQLEKADKMIRMRKENAAYMSQSLCRIRGIKTPDSPSGYNHVYQMYTIRLENSNIRDKLMRYLADSGIQTKVFFLPVHLTQFYRQKFGYEGGELPITEKVASEVLTLPMYPGLTHDEMDYIAQEIMNFFINKGMK